MFRGILAAILSLFLTGTALAQDGGDATALQTPQAVIDAQIAAFQQDDFDAAFDYASGFIRHIFQTPERFGQMVVAGYPMVHRPARVQYLDLIERPGMQVQRVLMTDQAGVLHLLEYDMIATPDGLRINGVRLIRGGAAGV